jgi:hypothetical protein
MPQFGVFIVLASWRLECIGKERERRKKWGSSERHYILGGVRKKETIFPVLMVPRQCQLILLVEAAHMIEIRFFIIFLFFFF